MPDIFSQIDFQHWLLRPFSERWWQETLCSMLVGVTCGVLGCYVVLRRMALIGDALSHAVLPGVVIAFLITNNTGIFGLLSGALLAGLVTAVLINLISRASRTKEDSSIGIVFTSLFAIGIILVSALPRGLHFDLKCFLFGDPLAVSATDLLLMVVICPVVLALTTALYHPFKLASFDPVVAAAMGVPVMTLHYLLMGMLSATVVAGIKTTGVILVVALVITPASAAYLLTNRLSRMMILAGAFGGISAVAGMTLSFVTNWPSGATMVVFATAIFGVVLLLSPSQGIVIKMYRRHKMQWNVECEDVLKTVYRNTHEGIEWCNLRLVTNVTRISLRRLHAIVAHLKKKALLHRNSDNELQLTASGRIRALEMVRSHRLWESYLTERAGMAVADVHEQAEQLEHVHELVDEVDRNLGHPRVDPHGETIPPGKKRDQSE